MPSRMIRVEPHGYSLPPQVISKMIDVVAIAIVAMPNQSVAPTALRFGNLRNAVMPVRAMMPKGTLSHIPQRQPGPSVNQPPSTGPNTLLTPNTEPMTPMYLPR